MTIYGNKNEINFVKSLLCYADCDDCSYIKECDANTEVTTCERFLNKKIKFVVSDSNNSDEFELRNLTDEEEEAYREAMNSLIKYAEDEDYNFNQ